MAKLNISTDQAAVVVVAESHLEDAFRDGTETVGSISVIPEMAGYSDLNPTQQQQTRSIFESCFAAILKALNIKRPLPNGITTTVTLAKLTPLGSNGSLTFVDGILTAKTDPT